MPWFKSSLEKIISFPSQRFNQLGTSRSVYFLAGAGPIDWRDGETKIEGPIGKH